MHGINKGEFRAAWITLVYVILGCLALSFIEELEKYRAIGGALAFTAILLYYVIYEKNKK